MFKGRLGLETARVPQADRHGLLWLERGKLYVEDGNLTFATAGTEDLKPGEYQIPFQTVSNLLLGPGTTISHDALRLLARHGTGLVAIGSGGVRFYASMPFGQDRSDLARRQTQLWADRTSRISVALTMYEIRLGEAPPRRDLDALRGIEGHRMKQVYRRLAEQHGVEWHGRRYDRANPEKDDTINTAINHASAAIRAAAMVAVTATSTIPQLGFIHETSREAFALDIADLYRSSVMLPVAFRATRRHRQQPWPDIESLTRRMMGQKIRADAVIPKMIDSIKKVLSADDDSRDT